MRRFLARLIPDSIPYLESEVPAYSIGEQQLFFGGYIANAKALADEARRRGHVRLSGDEAELAALASQWWGAALPRHVLGQYALAIYDQRTRSLLLTHDELGLVPLFFAVRKDEIIFGTFLEDVLRKIGDWSLDEEYMADYLARSLYFGSRTPFAQIRRLQPGESLTWKDGALIRHETWTLNETEPLPKRDPRYYEERLRQLLHEAVSSAIPPGGTVWCELSGGLDSSTVLSIAARSVGSRVEAVSFVYSQSHAADERAWIRPVLERYPVLWNSIDVDSVRPFGELPTEFVAEPGDRLVMQGFSRLYEDMVAQAGVSVVLTGQGGDAVFLGDRAGPYFLADLLRTCSYAQLRKGLEALVRLSPRKRSTTYWFSHYALSPLLRYLRRALVDDYFHRTPLAHWLSPDYCERMRLRRRSTKSYIPRMATVAGASFMERVLAVTNGMTNHGHYHNLRIDFRHPLLYRPLVEFMLALPWEQKFCPEHDRALQRRALVGLVPEKTLQRKDKGGASQAFFEGLESSPGWQQLLTTRPHIVNKGYVDFGCWRDAVQQACLGRTSGVGNFLAAASLEAWLQQLHLS